jgi:glutamate N-acetyltransferase/amino-acid N-acetyltransferase
MSVTAPKGFVAGGTACGIKASGRPDLALIATDDHRPATAAGVFTTNLVAAAPVQISRRHLADEHAVAVVLNSGNANAATGAAGRAGAQRMCAAAAGALGIEAGDVLVCSTGLIGIPLDVTPVERAMPALAATLETGEEAGRRAAEAIMTTDTRRKEALAPFETTLGNHATVGGMAKGAAMLSPAMATMLAVLTTDAPVEPAALRAALASAVHSSFDNLIVDGARSTNDTVLILANGRAGGATITQRSGEPYYRFSEAVASVCASLAEQMARDAEGATRFARIVVQGARSMHDARLAARAVASSQLVQCSLHGGDPYWGRVLSECGASGAVFDPEAVSIAYNGFTVCRAGIACDHDAAALAKTMTERDVEIRVELGGGHGEATVLTTDLSPAYIDENMRTS